MNRPSLPTGIEEFERALADCLAIAERAMPDCPMISIALCAGEGIRTAVCSPARAGLLDGLQSAAGQGPGLDAIGTGLPVTTCDLAGETRWPRLAVAAPRIRAVHCEPLESEGAPLGVLTVCSERAGAFAPETVTAAEVTAAHLGVIFRTALDAARTKEVAAQLKEALTTRTVIDQALGIVMAQRRCTSRHAFEILRHVSQDRNVKLHQVAASIVEKVSGEPAQRSRFEDPPQHVVRRRA
ncbi:GAF and ANTAR domain-containing protein [Nonomuraea candida]|uniref:GAF and ANTAR domain-containing protein n=1 Tax=Nonomuraea candida TaxID=359159 RepID=UPI0012FA46F6|nr:GAF and ANTAR domain-containing protein [Nonomuraea candida]